MFVLLKNQFEESMKVDFLAIDSFHLGCDRVGLDEDVFVGGGHDVDWFGDET